ncbi:MAG: hypothetical protein IPK07_08530 [Deltaproteobacteria bacterium]|nr:hypothetical protein [Deltaproteobacteria bacterium]
MLTSRLSAARGGPGDAPGPASDRELFRRMPGSALGSIVETEIDEITRRTDDLLFPIDGEADRSAGSAAPSSARYGASASTT